MPASNKTSLTDELIQKIKQVFDEHYSKMQSERIKAGLKKKKERGVLNDK